jgi:hypothetical protein
MIAGLVAGCGRLTGPEVHLAASRLEVHYVRFGGWSNTEGIDVYPDARVKAYHVSQGSLDTLGTLTSTLSTDQHREIADLFASFRAYSRHYQPGECRPSHAHHGV